VRQECLGASHRASSLASCSTMTARVTRPSTR
jgi:hypothetical protein